MPIYDIQCGNCNMREERLFKSHRDVEYYACPKCGSITWAKIPCRTNWALGRKLLDLDAKSEVRTPEGL